MLSISYDSTNKYYILTQSGQGQAFIPITPLANHTNFTVEAEIYFVYSSNNCIGFGVYKDSSNWCENYMTYTNNNNLYTRISGSDSENSVGSYSSFSGKWLKYCMKVNNTNGTIIFSIKDLSDNTVYSYTYTMNSVLNNSNNQYGFSKLWQSGNTSYIRNIKAYSN
jgi:hypothetical protein